MEEMKIAPHEVFAMHELLQLKNIWTLKIAGLTGQIADPKLRSILETDLENSQKQIETLRDCVRQYEFGIN
ncbi:hypothetical protein LPY66_15800 [Dehalobacter sp. DCM]|uniref:hypothetical protein n=1 Tax=Dehalobacter sp. DCM TaxID=2907827 RepID=UPI003081EA21|nr:hypothetical protein LPY66_15800 [Dehalobacter sp. DCM]